MEAKGRGGKKECGRKALTLTLFIYLFSLSIYKLYVTNIEVYNTNIED